MENYRILAVAALLALTGSACSGTPKPSGNTDAGATPSNANPDSHDAFKTGTAHVEVTGDITKTYEMPIAADKSRWNPAPSGMSMFWTDASNNAVGLGGSSGLGSRPTGALMNFTLTLFENGSPLLGISSKGECTVNVTRSEAGGVEGTVTCTGWKIDSKTINVKATLTAIA